MPKATAPMQYPPEIKIAARALDEANSRLSSILESMPTSTTDDPVGQQNLAIVLRRAGLECTRVIGRSLEVLEAIGLNFPAGNDGADPSSAAFDTVSERPEFVAEAIDKVRGECRRGL